MAEPFQLRTSDGCEWIMHPPVDPYGDGYVRTADVEIRADGVTACTTATLSVEPGGIDLAGFLAGLAADWRGWDGKRRWQALEREMEIEAWHDGRAQVMLAVTVRRPERAYADDAWSARVVFTVEAGEEFATLAKEIISLLETRSGICPAASVANASRVLSAVPSQLSTELEKPQNPAYRGPACRHSPWPSWSCCGDSPRTAPVEHQRHAGDPLAAGVPDCDWADSSPDRFLWRTRPAIPFNDPLYTCCQAVARNPLYEGKWAQPSKTYATR